MKTLAFLSCLSLLMLIGVPAQAIAKNTKPVVVTRLAPVNGTDVKGVVILRQLKAGGTDIHVIAKNLDPGTQYVSLYYDNDHCALEPYSPEDIIGGPYTANRGGVGLTQGEADDDLDEIHSVSVRLAKNFDTDAALQACAKVG
jgi:hypothetical protein